MRSFSETYSYSYVFARGYNDLHQSAVGDQHKAVPERALVAASHVSHVLLV